MVSSDKPRRILLVDDEQIVRKALQSFLANAGYAVEAVEAGEAALGRLETESFDLVVTDNHMPGMTGVQLASIIKIRWPALPILMFTGFLPDEPVPCLDRILHKPGDLRLLVPSIQELMAARPRT